MPCIAQLDNFSSNGIFSGVWDTGGVFTYIGYSTVQTSPFGAGGNWPWATANWGDSINFDSIEEGYYQLRYDNGSPPSSSCYVEFIFVIKVVQGAFDVPNDIIINVCPGAQARNIFDDSTLFDKSVINPVLCVLGGSGTASPGYNAGTVSDVTDDTYTANNEVFTPVVREFEITYTPESGSCINCDPKTIKVTYNVIDPGVTVNIIDNPPYCVGQNVNVEVIGAPPGAILNWVVIFGNLVSGQGTTQIQVAKNFPGNVFAACQVIWMGCSYYPGVNVLFIDCCNDLSVNITPTGPIKYCAGQNGVILTANITGGTGPFNYVWKNQLGSVIGNNSTQVVFITFNSQNQTGLYSLEVTDSLGCTDMDTVQIDYFPRPPVWSFSTPQPACVGEWIKIDPQNIPAGSTQNWITPGAVQSYMGGFLHLLFNTPGNKTWTLELDYLGCIHTYMFGGNVGNCCTASPSIAEIENNPCDFDLTVIGYPPGSTFVWSTAETTETINVTSSGTYSVAITTPFECTYNASHVVSACDLPCCGEFQSCVYGTDWAATTGATNIYGHLKLDFDGTIYTIPLSFSPDIMIGVHPYNPSVVNSINAANITNFSAELPDANDFNDCATIPTATDKLKSKIIRIKRPACLPFILDWIRPNGFISERTTELGSEFPDYVHQAFPCTFTWDNVCSGGMCTRTLGWNMPGVNVDQLGIHYFFLQLSPFVYTSIYNNPNIGITTNVGNFAVNTVSGVNSVDFTVQAFGGQFQTVNISWSSVDPTGISVNRNLLFTVLNGFNPSPPANNNNGSYLTGIVIGCCNPKLTNDC